MSRKIVLLLLALTFIASIWIAAYVLLSGFVPVTKFSSPNSALLKPAILASIVSCLIGFSLHKTLLPAMVMSGPTVLGALALATMHWAQDQPMGDWPLVALGAIVVCSTSALVGSSLRKMWLDAKLTRDP